MTFAPEAILEVRRFLKHEDGDLSDVELGIVGGPSHITEGTSYHLGADQLKMFKNPYSARTSRDRAGLSNAASALDIDDDLDELRQMSVWLVDQCRAGAPDTLDIREVIYSPDGVRVLRWDRERGQQSLPFPDSDLSHRTHTHVSWYRDSEFRSKVGPFQRFFGENMAIDENSFNILIWRVDAEIYDLPSVRGGPLEGERNEPHHARKAIETRITGIENMLKEILAKPPGSVDPEAIRPVVRQELDGTGLAKK